MSFSKEAVEAFIKFQSEVGPVLRDSKNPFFKSNYATLDAVINVTYPTLHKHGFMVTQTTDLIAQEPVLVTRLYYTNGEYIEGRYPLIPKELDDPQKLGSCVTYARRYALMGILGLAPEDDDGNTASGRGDSKASAPAPIKPKDSPSKPAGKAASPGALASDKQVDWIISLMSQKLGIDDGSKAQVDWLVENVGNDLDKMTKGQASAAIEQLNAMPDKKPAKAKPTF